MNFGNLADITPSMLNSVLFQTRLLLPGNLFSNTFTKTCHRCKTDVDSYVEHIFCLCPCTSMRRLYLYCMMILYWDNSLFNKYMTLSPREKVISLSTGMRTIVNNINRNHHFLCQSIRLISGIWLNNEE